MSTDRPPHWAMLAAWDEAFQKALALPYTNHPDYREEWKP